MAPGQEANGDNLGKYFRTPTNNGMFCVLIRIALVRYHYCVADRKHFPKYLFS